MSTKTVANPPGRCVSQVEAALYALIDEVIYLPGVNDQTLELLERLEYAIELARIARAPKCRRPR